MSNPNDVLGHPIEAGGMGDICRFSVVCASPAELRARFDELMACRLPVSSGVSRVSAVSEETGGEKGEQRGAGEVGERRGDRGIEGREGKREEGWKGGGSSPVEVVRVKNGFHPGAEPGIGGYRDVKLNLMVDVPFGTGNGAGGGGGEGKEVGSQEGQCGGGGDGGGRSGGVVVRHVVEAQLLLAEYEEVKQSMHMLYKVVRGDW